jgi:hypothetical protein
MQSVQISFRGTDEDSLFVQIRNPRALPAGLLHQVKRYGLTGPTSQKPYLSGRSNGTRRALTELIQTYGLSLDIVPFEDKLAP